MAEKEKRRKKRKESYQKSLDRISREVSRWPKWKQNLSALGSNYCSELQPLRDGKSDIVDF